MFFSKAHPSLLFRVPYFLFRSTADCTLSVLSGTPWLFSYNDQVALSCAFRVGSPRKTHWPWRHLLPPPPRFKSCLFNPPWCHLAILPHSSFFCILFSFEQFFEGCGDHVADGAPGFLPFRVFLLSPRIP